MDNQLIDGLKVSDVEEYLARIDDRKAETQARTQPLRQALRVFKFLYGYGGKRTMQHNKGMCEAWNRIVMKVKRKYGIFEKSDWDPTILGEMNLYAINLMKDELS